MFVPQTPLRFPGLSCRTNTDNPFYGQHTDMRITKNLGMLLLSIWLIATGLGAFIPAISGLGLLLSILAIAAGVLILLGR